MVQSSNSIFRVFWIFLLGILLSISIVKAGEGDFPARPNPPRLVNDFAGLLQQNEANQLESKLVAYNDSTSTQIAIVTIPDLKGHDVSEYAFKLGEMWGIGTKKKDNGILLLVCTNPRKIFIATGYGVEQYVTDAYSKRIIETIIKPEFKAGNIYTGLDKGADALLACLQGKFKADSPKSKKGFGGSAIIFVIVIIIIVIILMKRFGNRNYYSDGPGFGGGWMTFGSGGFSSGGSDSSDSGGFDGFGGGSFGGGGAGGDW